MGKQYKYGDLPNPSNWGTREKPGPARKDWAFMGNYPAETQPDGTTVSRAAQNEMLWLRAKWGEQIGFLVLGPALDSETGQFTQVAEGSEVAWETTYSAPGQPATQPLEEFGVTSPDAPPPEQVSILRLGPPPRTA